MSVGAVLWLSGLPACGVTGIAHRVAELLHARAVPAEVLDEREMHHGATGYRYAAEGEWWSGRGSMVGYLAPIFARNGVLPICIAPSPARMTPEDVRAPGARLIVVAVECSAAEGEQRSRRRLHAAPTRRAERKGSQGTPLDRPADVTVQRRPGRLGQERAATEVIRALEQLGLLACRGEPTRIAAEQADEVRRRLSGLGYM